MEPDLLATFASAFNLFPPEQESPVVLRRGNVPRAPRELCTTELMAVAGTHHYESLTIDAIHFSGTKRAYRALALLCFSVLLHEEPTTACLNLLPPKSDARRLLITNELIYLNPEFASGERALIRHPQSFSYFPSEAYRHPFAIPNDQPKLPQIRVTDEALKAQVYSPTKKRDTLVGFGNDVATAAMGELLLNFSQPGNAEDQIDLECFAGFMGVAPGSAEITLWLPGAIGYLLPV